MSLIFRPINGGATTAVRVPGTPGHSVPPAGTYSDTVYDAHAPALSRGLGDGTERSNPVRETSSTHVWRFEREEGPSRKFRSPGCSTQSRGESTTQRCKQTSVGRERRIRYRCMSRRAGHSNGRRAWWSHKCTLGKLCNGAFRGVCWQSV